MKKQEFDLLRAMDGIPEDMANDALPARFGGRHPVRQIIRSRRKALWAAAIAAVVGLNVFAVTEIRKAMRTAPQTADTDTVQYPAKLPDLSAFGVDMTSFAMQNNPYTDDHQFDDAYQWFYLGSRPTESWTLYENKDGARLVFDRQARLRRFFNTPEIEAKHASEQNPGNALTDAMDKAAADFAKAATQNSSLPTASLSLGRIQYGEEAPVYEASQQIENGWLTIRVTEDCEVQRMEVSLEDRQTLSDAEQARYDAAANTLISAVAYEGKGEITGRYFAPVGGKTYGFYDVLMGMGTDPEAIAEGTWYLLVDPDGKLRETRQPIPEAVELTALPDLSAFGIDTARFEKTQETALNDMIERQAGIKYPAIPMNQITAPGMDMLGFTEPEEVFTVWRSPDEAVILTDRWGCIRYYAAPAETRKQAALHSSNDPAQPELDSAVQFVQAMLPAGAEAYYSSRGLMQYSYSTDTDAAAMQCMMICSITGAGGSDDFARLWLTEDGTVLEYGAFYCHYVGGDSPAEEEELMGFAKLLSDTVEPYLFYRVGEKLCGILNLDAMTYFDSVQPSEPRAFRVWLPEAIELQRAEIPEEMQEYLSTTLPPAVTTAPPVQSTDLGTGNTAYTTTALTQPPYTGTGFTTTADPPPATTHWIGGSKTMTLDDVRTLAKKGMKLGWADFEPYRGSTTFTETNLRLWQYEFGEYTLEVFGWYSESAVYDPELDSVTLQWKGKETDMITDIRTGNLEQFLTDCRDYYLTTTIPTKTTETTTTTTALPAAQTVTVPKNGVYRWVDTGWDMEGSPFNVVETLRLTEAPDLTFAFVKGEYVNVMRGDTVIASIGGMPVWKVYFADLDGDGYAEMITDESIGSGIVSELITVYDYHNDKTYAINDRGTWDYTLCVDGGGTLRVKRFEFNASFIDMTEYELGRLVLQEGKLTWTPIDE